jgi:hypothetical protein
MKKHALKPQLIAKKQLSFDIKYDNVDIPRLVALLSILLYNK